jgi:hypothetical protein
MNGTNIQCATFKIYISDNGIKIETEKNTVKNISVVIALL